MAVQLSALVVYPKTTVRKKIATHSGIRSPQYLRARRIEGIDKWGAGKITGTVLERPLGAPEDGVMDAAVSRRVRLVRDVDGVLIREHWSDPNTGAYAFLNVPLNVPFTILAYDHTATFRAVVADRTVAVPMVA